MYEYVSHSVRSKFKIIAIKKLPPGSQNFNLCDNNQSVVVHLNWTYFGRTLDFWDPSFYHPCCAAGLNAKKMFNFSGELKTFGNFPRRRRAFFCQYPDFPMGHLPWYVLTLKCQPDSFECIHPMELPIDHSDLILAMYF